MHNAAAAHPLIFVLRRVLYSIVIVFMVGEKVVFGALLLLLTSLAALIFVANEAQWEDRMNNIQHLLNEAIFYLVCMGLVCFSGIIFEAKQSVTLGWLLIGIIVVMISFNALYIMYTTCVHMKLVILRYRPKFLSNMSKMLSKLGKTKKRDD